MYNFLVAGHWGVWDSRRYRYPRDRFAQGEATPPALKARFEQLAPDAIEELKALPALFAYEGTEHDVRVGYITTISDRGSQVYLELEFDPRIPPIPFSKIEPLRFRLDLADPYEIGHGHWAIKRVDLLGVLAEAGLIDAALAGASWPRPPIDAPRSWIELGKGGFGSVYRITDEHLGSGSMQVARLGARGWMKRSRSSNWRRSYRRS